MGKDIPYIILDDDEEDDVQITGVVPCTNRDNSLFIPTQEATNQNESLFVTQSPPELPAEIPVSTGNDAHAQFLAGLEEWLHPSISPGNTTSPTQPYSPSWALQFEEVRERSQVPSVTPMAAPTSPSKVKIPSSAKNTPDPPFTRKFFTDMIDTIAHSFPYGAFAEKHNCPVDQVNSAVIAVVLNPLMNNVLGNLDAENGDEDTVERRGQLLIKKWNERYQAMVHDLQNESEGNGLPMEFGQILVAASGNAEAYWKARNRPFDPYLAFQEAKKRSEGGTEEGDGVDESVVAEEPQAHSPTTPAPDAFFSGVDMNGENEVIEAVAVTPTVSPSRKRARSLSVTGSSPTLGQMSNSNTSSSSSYTPPAKKAKSVPPPGLDTVALAAFIPAATATSSFSSKSQSYGIHTDGPADTYAYGVQDTPATVTTNTDGQVSSNTQDLYSTPAPVSGQAMGPATATAAAPAMAEPTAVERAATPAPTIAPSLPSPPAEPAAPGPTTAADPVIETTASSTVSAPAPAKSLPTESVTAPSSPPTILAPASGSGPDTADAPEKTPPAKPSSNPTTKPASSVPSTPTPTPAAKTTTAPAPPTTPSSTSITPSHSHSHSLSTTPSTPTPLPTFIPSLLRPLTSTTNPTQPKKPSLFTRSTTRHPVTVDVFGNYQPARARPRDPEPEHGRYRERRVGIGMGMNLSKRRESESEREREREAQDSVPYPVDEVYIDGVVDKTRRVFSEEGVGAEVFWR
ncbi:hypothetical protein FQN52_002705, partial [Onygenales sp. PD_12]